MLDRRRFLGRTGAGVIGSAALAFLSPRVELSHFPATARRVIYLNMLGAPSQVDLFDYKPLLRKLNGSQIPPSAIDGQRFTTMTETTDRQVFASPWRFSQYGQNGLWLSELLPHLRGILDEITVVRSMHTSEINHAPAQLFFQTGFARAGRPTLGSWVTYGLGSECENLPGFVVMTSGKASRCGTTCWQSGFLPSVYQGVPFRSQGDPVLFLSNPDGIDRDLRRASLDAVRNLNQINYEQSGDPEILTRIESFEMAFRMQMSVPELTDFSTESAQTLALYGAEPGQSSFANNCLLARRLIERGVRFVQLDHGGWDHHGGGDQNLMTNLPKRCEQTDRASAALVIDLKHRGLLDDTLVIWGGEFGRLPIAQIPPDYRDAGRDHLRTAFTLWMAGGGIKRGAVIGRTDNWGLNVVEDAVHVHDLQATILHTLGLNHEELTFRHLGRDYRLTDVHGVVAEKLLS